MVGYEFLDMDGNSLPHLEDHGEQPLFDKVTVEGEDSYGSELEVCNGPEAHLASGPDPLLVGLSTGWILSGSGI